MRVRLNDAPSSLILGILILSTVNRGRPLKIIGKGF